MKAIICSLLTLAALAGCHVIVHRRPVPDCPPSRPPIHRPAPCRETITGTVCGRGKAWSGSRPQAVVQLGNSNLSFTGDPGLSDPCGVRLDCLRVGDCVTITYERTPFEVRIIRFQRH
jgi:hypothetical protein